MVRVKEFFVFFRYPNLHFRTSLKQAESKGGHLVTKVVRGDVMGRCSRRGIWSTEYNENLGKALVGSVCWGGNPLVKS